MPTKCDFMELTEEVLQQCNGFTCKDADITEFFTHDYADYTYQLLGKSYCLSNRTHLKSSVLSQSPIQVLRLLLFLLALETN